MSLERITIRMIIQKEERIIYAWNEELQKYCLGRHGKNNKPIFFKPIKELKLSEMNLDDNSLCETIQDIYYKHNGKFNKNLEFKGREYAIELAKKMGVW